MQNEWALSMDSKNEFVLSVDSWIHYVWTNYYSQITDSTIHETFCLIQLIKLIHLISKLK